MPIYSANIPMTIDLNSDWLDRDHQHMIHPLHDATGHHQAGRVWVKGEGSYLIDADGNRIIDGLSSLWNVSAGHSRPELAEAAARQMRTLAFASGYSGSTSQPAIELAERLAALTSPNINHFFFTSGGGESTDSSIKAARSYWKLKGKPEKTRVIGRQWGYHGVTLAAMSCTGIEAYWGAFEPKVPGISHIPSPDPYHYPVPEDGSSQGMAAANELEKEILRLGPDTVAMFIAEPVQGAGGVIVPQDDYFGRIRAICDQYEVLLVADEVITGFGRTGRMFGLEHYGVQPDILQFAKSITSGALPLGGIGVSDEIAAVILASHKPWMHAYTYSGHPTTCAVGLATLDIIEKENLPRQAAMNGEAMLQQYRDALEDHPHVGHIRGKGMMHGIEIVKDRSTREWFEPSFGLTKKLSQAMLGRGLYTRIRSEIIVSAPPLNTPVHLLDQMVEIVHDAVVEVLGS